MSDLRGRDERGAYRYVDVATTRTTIASSRTSPASTTDRKSPPAPTMPDLPKGARRVKVGDELVTLTARELARAESIRATPEAYAAAKLRVASRRR